MKVLFEKAYEKADQGDSDAQAELSRFYRRGLGTEESTVLSFLWAQQSFHSGHPYGYYSLAVMCDEGIGGLEKDPTLANHYFTEAFNRKDDVGEHASPGWLTALGAMYQYGKGTEQNIAMAYYYYELAAQKNYPLAQYALGEIYERGIGGLNKDLTTAMSWYKKSADQGYVIAQTNLAALFTNEQVIVKDDQQSFFWYQKAAMAGDKLAMVSTASCCQHGIGVNKEIVQAINWYKKSALLGEHRAVAALKVLAQQSNHHAQEVLNDIEVELKQKELKNKVIKDFLLTSIAYQIDANKAQQRIMQQRYINMINPEAMMA